MFVFMVSFFFYICTSQGSAEAN